MKKQHVGIVRFTRDRHIFEKVIVNSFINDRYWYSILFIVHGNNQCLHPCFTTFSTNYKLKISNQTLQLENVAIIIIQVVGTRSAFYIGLL